MILPRLLHLRFSHHVVALAALSFSSAFAALPPRGWSPNPFAPLTPERIAALPAAERAVWQAYWDASEQLAAKLPVRPQPDRSLLKPMSTPPKGGIHSKGLRLTEPTAWYATDEARTIANRIISAQTPVGAWMKGVDYGQAINVKVTAESSPTFDNDATISELRFLLQVLGAGDRHPQASAWHDSFERGLRYVFAAQYPNGGFPQLYPLVGGYHDGVTFNDDAMTQILEFLRDIAGGQNEYATVPTSARNEASDRLKSGIRCVLATQLKNTKGHLTVWCQQYDPLTLQPAAARNFEPVADVSRESASIVLLLMSLPNPSTEIVKSIEGATTWFRATALHDLKIAHAPADVRGEAIRAPGAPLLWARFYEPGTTTPIFGDRDRTVHYDLAEISSERIAGYSWYTNLPVRVLAEFEPWQKKNRVAGK